MRVAKDRSRAPIASSSPTGTAPIAARSFTLTSTEHQPAHSGSRSTSDGTIASQAATRSLPGTGAPSSPMKPAGPIPCSSGPRSLLVAATNCAIRPIGQRINTCSVPATVTGLIVSQPSRWKNRCVPVCTVASNRNAPAASALAHAARTSAAPTPLLGDPDRRLAVTSRPPCHHPISGPSVAGPSRTPPITAPSGPLSNQYDGARVLVAIVQIGAARTDLCSSTKASPPQGAVGLQVGRIGRLLDQKGRPLEKRRISQQRLNIRRPTNAP